MKLGEAIYKSQQSAKPGDAPKDTKQEGKKDDNDVDEDFDHIGLDVDDQIKDMKIEGNWPWWK